MVLNAVDAMPVGGQLTLAAEDVEDSVVISVGDTGTGMVPEVTSRIFDPFFTTKGKAGMGLGLAVSFGIIRRHEGSVEVESEVGAGTRFKISLPKAKVGEDSVLLEPERPKLLHEKPNAIASRTFDHNQPKILVVDDEEGVRELLRDLLEGDEFRALQPSTTSRGGRRFSKGRIVPQRSRNPYSRTLSTDHAGRH